jgi:hypothetical protein
MGFIQAGILAIAAFSFLIVVSLRPVRKAAYEFFFFLHFIMVLYVRLLPLWTFLLTSVLLVFSSSVVTSIPRTQGKQ